MAPEVATIVYAMCTLGAIFASKDSTSGTLDNVVHDFHKRTLAIKCERPEDIATIQTLLILQEFYVVTNQMDMGTKTFQNMLDIADAIKLKDMVKRISTQDKLSPADAIIRNIWRMIVWTETFANIVSMRTARIEPEKDLTGPALDFRKEEAPIARSPALDAAIFYLGNLFKIYQEISKIRLPISNHDIHPVMSVLEAFTAWHGSLPKNLRCTQNRGYSSGGVSPLASYLDLYYKLGHIFVLNNLPVLWRNKAASLGGRRESALRTLATSANGITATVGDLVKEHDLRNHCLIPAIRCLTEAATIQLANAQVQDPSLSTPAKVNFMKTLWCIKQFNFSLPADVLSSILAPYDDALKNASSNTSSMTSSTQGQDTAPGDDSTQGREESHQPAKEVGKDSSQDNNAASTLVMSVDSSSVPKRKPSPEPSARAPPKGKRSRTRSPSVSADSHPLRERMRRGSEALPESQEEYEHPHEAHPSHSQGPKVIGADIDYPPHERTPSSSRHSEQEPWHGHHHVYTSTQGRLPADPRLTSRGNLDEMARHRPSSPRHEGHYSLPAQQWEDPEHLRPLPVEDDRSPLYSSYPGSFSSRPGAYMGMDQERMYHRRYHGPEEYEYSSRPHPAHPSTSFPRHSRHVHEYPSEADLQSRLVPGYPRPGYPQAASHTTAYDMYDGRQRQRHERRISDAIHSDDLRDARSQTHRAVDVRSRKEPLPSSSSPSGMPPSPLVATGGRGRSSSGPVEASRRPEGVMVDGGARVVGSYNVQSGTARASPLPESGERDDGISYNKDLFHQGSAEAARTREQRQLMREDYGHYESYPQRGGSPTEFMREYRGQAQYQQLPRNTMARPPYVEHYTTSYPSHPSHPSHPSYSSPSDYHSIPPHHPRSSGPSSYSSYEHYSQPHQPAMSYQYRYSRRQHEPRTSYPSTTTSSLHQSSDNMSSSRSAPSQQHRYPDHYDDQRSHYEHHPGHADVNARQSQQEQDRSLDRTRTGPSLPSGPRETGVAAGTGNGKDRDGEDPGRVSDQLRDPVHRKS
ncbi:hypothetical protein BGX34_002517 [Mortierella sp. NVP85]|nr:hypothetical protein BGX34_002517 [Mortierella sp. NVP85]